MIKFKKIEEPIEFLEIYNFLSKEKPQKIQV